MTRIHLLKPGTFRDMNGNDVSFTASDIAAIAKSYDPKLSAAPIVVGHPKIDDPAYGWTASLETDSDGLHANAQDIDPAFADLVRAKRYRTVSASLYRPDSPGNPKPGQWYLRHIGFLGAQPPAVKGLKPVALGADGQGVTTVELAADEDSDGKLWRQFKSWLKSQLTADLSDSPAPASDPLANFSEEQEATLAETKELEAREAQLAERETALAAREKSIADAEAQTRQADCLAFADALVKEGKLLPADKPVVLDLLLGIKPDGKVDLADGSGTKTVSMDAATRAFFQRLPKIVPLGEHAPRNAAALATDAQDPVALAEAASALVAKMAVEGKTISHAEAVERIAREHEARK